MSEPLQSPFLDELQQGSHSKVFSDFHISQLFYEIPKLHTSWWITSIKLWENKMSKSDDFFLNLPIFFAGKNIQGRGAAEILQGIWLMKSNQAWK